MREYWVFVSKLGALSVADTLIRAGIPFKMMPFPFDNFRVTVKEEYTTVVAKEAGKFPPNPEVE
jgi:hypothetical protein